MTGENIITEENVKSVAKIRVIQMQYLISSIFSISGTPKSLVRHSRFKNKDGQSVVDRFKTQPISFNTVIDTQPSEESFALVQSKSTANVLDRDEDGKLKHQPLRSFHVTVSSNVQIQLNFILFSK